MQTSKPWYASKTIWGSIVAVLAIGASAIGFDLGEGDRERLVDAILQLIAGGGAVLAVFGRVVATDMID